MGLQSKHLRIDHKLCTDCGICELVCSFMKFKLFNPKISLIKINYNYELGVLERAVICNQCGTCLKVCPTGALHIANGFINLNHSICSSCLACVEVCPNDAFVVVDGKPYKCDLCGGSPQCVKYCTRGALNVS
ncbi:MAG: 4Fe-4S dicluster domain-containing protein [Sulfolobales archaeon]|nr:4Fe-4S dicluster domain-containing protein [Sulfolobales archaeon]MCX8185993.1 4Fe-4S dicluster domain-containing protein [Sulfolobales archaeon]MDW7969250.1 4Fe-4S dicluster domain-containing protein [Sulfolobales archaeon]